MVNKYSRLFISRYEKAGTKSYLNLARTTIVRDRTEKFVASGVGEIIFLWMLQERVMRTSIIPFISGQNVFDPDLAKALGDAYDAACDELEPSVQTDLVRNNSQADYPGREER